MKSGATASLLAALAAAGMAAAGYAAGAPPNIVFLLADDMGSGDVSALNSGSAWHTPRIDALARQGMSFTDAHSSSAVCTPSRYSILTGRYCWRSPRKEGVGGGYSPALLEPGRLTVPLFLRRHGYATAAFGKWHLGLDWSPARRSGATPDGARQGGPRPPGEGIWDDDPGDGDPGHRPSLISDGSPHVDWERPFGGGPLAHGFDVFYGISASLDMPPYVWLDGDRAASAPTHRIAGSALPAYWRAGAIADDFAHVDVLGRLTEKAVAYVHERARDPGHRPFFLYFAMTAPHTPIVLAPPFQGKTGTTPYGDFCVQVDGSVGQVADALRAEGLDSHTLLIFTADNGCSPSADFPALKKFHHDPQMGFRGAKADIYEGGHRIPLIARWPGHVPAGSRSDRLIGQLDLLATCADLLGSPLPAGAGEDSVTLLPALTGKNGPRHEGLVHSSINGSFAIRQGRWKLCLCPDSGGWSEPLPGKAPPGSPPFQLFDLQSDPAERTNLYPAHREVAAQLGRLLKKYVREGRSTPGPPQANEGGPFWPQLDWMKQFPN